MIARATALVRPPRRGACPGLSAPMPTGDGLLVRLMPIGTIALDGLAALCAAARTCGNGIVEITARGSIQVRGLSEASAPQFAAAVAALGIAVGQGVAVLANPLTGLDAAELFDAGALACALRHALADRDLAAKLAPKVSVLIDGGGALDLDGLAADIRLRAEAVDGTVVLHIAVGGNCDSAAPLGRIAAANAAEAVLRLLDVLARHGSEARAKDLILRHGTAPFEEPLRDLLLTPAPRSAAGAPKTEPALASRRRANERPAATLPHVAIGTFPLRDGTCAVGVGVAFGHAEAAGLEQLIEATKTAGARGLRAAPRALFAVGIVPQRAPDFAAAAESLGFIVRPDDPRRYVIACAGAPICASAKLASRSIAPVVADRLAAFLEPARIVHISGCAKGCAHAGPAAVTIVGTAEGCALIANGLARDPPVGIVAAGQLPGAVAKMLGATDSERDHV